MRFDWYSATVQGRPELVLESIQAAFGTEIAQIERLGPISNYAVQDVFSDAMGDRVCAVLHGGPNGPHGTHVRSSGVHSPAVAAVLRDRWQGHSVSRVDVALDFDGPDCWLKLQDVALQNARARKLKWATYGDFRDDRDPLSGRTIYVGSRQSPVSVRVYEKGKQLLPSIRIGEPLPSLDWCRLEIEVKPHRHQAKISASVWSPEDFWGCSTWSRKLLKDACGLDVERKIMGVRKESDARRAIRHMGIQYRQAMETVIQEEGGDPDAVMKLIREVWADYDRISKAA